MSSSAAGRSRPPSPLNGSRPTRRRGRWSTTPGRLRLLLTLAILGACLAWLAGGAAVVTTRAEVDGFGYRTAPAAATALRLHAYLADADRLAANDFLLGAQGSNEKRQEYQLDIATAVRELETAAQLGEPGSQAEEQLRRIGVLLVQYTGLIETARANARSPSLGPAYLHQASELMHRPGDGILAIVATLASASPDDQAADQTRLRLLAGTIAAFFVIAVALLCLLVYSQVFLVMRFRRRSSPPILAAILVLAGLSVWVAAHAWTTYRDLSVAEGVTYAELHRLSLMQSLAADANANESLFLISRGDTSLLQSDFQATTGQLASPAPSDDSADAAIRGDVRFSGLMADELRDARTPSERAAARRILRGYQEFLAMDANFRAKATAGKYADALSLVVGAAQSGAAYTDLNVALEQRFDVEQARFDAAVADARPDLPVDAGIGLSALVIVLLVLAGFRPRIAEYTSGDTFEPRGGRWMRLPAVRDA